MEKTLENFVHGSKSKSDPALSEQALTLMSWAPLAGRDAAFNHFSNLIDSAIDHELSKSTKRNEKKQLELFFDKTTKLLQTNPKTWSSVIVSWSLGLLGEMSSKYSAKLASSHSSSVLALHESLPRWLELYPTRLLIDLTSQSLTALLDDPDETEVCVSNLLDTSVRHSPNFDWVVAHVGGSFPETVIRRVLSVGLKDFCQSAETQIARDGNFNLSKVPKLNSVVGILNHLATTHANDIKSNLNDLADNSIRVVSKSKAKASLQDIGSVPYLLFLASLSETMRSTLTHDIYQRFMSKEVCNNLAILVELWEKHFFPAENALLDLIVHLIICCEKNSMDILCMMLNLSQDKFSDFEVSRDVRHGSRQVLEHVLVELQTSVHQKSGKLPTDNDIPFFKFMDINVLLSQYFFSNDLFVRRFMISFMSSLALTKGRTVAVKTVKFGLLRAQSESDLASVLEFIRETELWITDIVELAVCQSLRHSKDHKDYMKQLLINLGKILHHQNGQEETDDEKTHVLSQFREPVRKCHSLLLEILNRLEYIPHVLKIFHFVPLETEVESVDVGLIFKAARTFSDTFFILLEHFDTFDDEDEAMQYISSCVSNLVNISKAQPGLPMVLRFLVEGGINSDYAVKLMGAKCETTLRQDGKDPNVNKKKPVSLLEENMKFGSMPTHPLGSTTVFHAGVIGDGKRELRKFSGKDKDKEDFNRFTFLAALFKVCQWGGKDRAKESSKQLALLLVELVTPDVMYNGLPWPDEEFTKVTIERDLKIAKAFEDHPVLWKILTYLAESRPALCYCSVLLRALMAVQMNFWQSSVAIKARNCPKQLSTTKQVLELMSIGQYLPHPLNALSDAIHEFHAFHLHCILLDVWNFMKDNVPSPVAFASNSEGLLNREFETYKNYRGYCERLRLIMIHHLGTLPLEFKGFFIDSAEKSQDKDSKDVAMEPVYLEDA